MTDVAALVLRATLGLMLGVHGWNKVAGPGGLDGTAGWFAALGLRPAALHARLAAGTEILAGAALVLGVANPLPAAAAVGLMTVAARTDHRGKGFFVFKGGWEYTAVVGGAAVALAVLGAGRYSIDHLLHRDRPGPGLALLGSGGGAGLFAAGAGVLSALVLLRLCYRPTGQNSAN